MEGTGDREEVTGADAGGGSWGRCGGGDQTRGRCAGARTSRGQGMGGGGESGPDSLDSLDPRTAGHTPAGLTGYHPNYNNCSTLGPNP